MKQTKPIQGGRFYRCITHAAGLILILGTVSGCKTGRLGNLAMLGQSHSIVASPVEASDQNESNRNTPAKPDTVALVSANSTARRIRNLNPGEDLQTICEQSPGVVLVDFYADWCGPCKKQASVLHDVEEFAVDADAQIIKVNVDQHRGLAREYQVASLPTLVAIENGVVRETKTGLTSKSKLQSMLR